MIQLPVYLDYNATTPCDPRVVETMLPFFSKHFGNASSHTHPFGWQAREAVEIAREQVAALIGAEAGEIIFTSGATEAINLALKGVFESYWAKGNHIITCVTEHKAVLDTCRELERKGAEVTYLPVGRNGRTDPALLAEAFTPATILVCILYANNETGVLQDIPAFSALARERGVLFMTDGTQAAGKIPVNTGKDGIDLMAFSGHKIYGPKGVGGLYVRRRDPRVSLHAQIRGGGHEKGWRSGTLNVPGIAGLGRACELCAGEMQQEAERLQLLRDRLEKSLLALPGVSLNGDENNRLPHVSNLSFRQAPGNTLISELSKEIALSSGSACTSALPAPSHVLLGMGVEEELARASLRFSLGRMTTEEETDFAARKVSRVYNRLSLNFKSTE